VSLGFIVIEVCDANPAADPRLFQLEEKYPQVTVLENSCMSECELCRQHPYVFLNGELLFEETVDGLLTRIEQFIQQTVG
jgi:uncharacterized protein YuzB (UPF0349 family)